MANIIEMPKLGFDMAEGTLIKWVKTENEKVEKGEVLAEIETDKAILEIESSYSGVVYKHLAKEGEALPIGSPIAVIADEREKVDLDKLLKDREMIQPEEYKNDQAQLSVKEESKEEKHEKGGKEEEFIKASPIAKRIAELGAINLAGVAGTGPGGRIVKRDVEKAMEERIGENNRKTEKTNITTSEDETFEISKLRAAIGRRMHQSHHDIPHFFITSEYDVADMLKTRKQINKDLPDEEKVSVNDFIIKAVALSVRDFPNLNASISGTKLTHHKNINIGVAVAVENGLLTVVVRNADQKSLNQISGETKLMIDRIKKGKARNVDIEGSTITISNLGMYNVEGFVAIINPPEAAILAVGSAKKVPIVREGNLDIGWRMKVTLSADHRITDGAEAAKFMQHLAQFLEHPWRLFA